MCCDRELDPTLYFQFVLACFLPIRAYSADHYSLEKTSYNIQKPRLPCPDDLRERLSSSERNKCEQNVLNILVPTYDFSQHIECFHMTSRWPYWCPKTIKRRPCWCPKPVLWELNSFLMQTLSFVPKNLHRC